MRVTRKRVQEEEEEEEEENKEEKEVVGFDVLCQSRLRLRAQVTDGSQPHHSDTLPLFGGTLNYKKHAGTTLYNVE